MSKRERHLKQRLDELFSTAEESEAVAAGAPAVQSPTPIEPAIHPPLGDLVRLLTVIEQLPLPAYLKDHEHTWVAVNAAYGELIGHAPAKLIGHTDKEQADEAWQLDDRVLDTGQPEDTQETVTLPNGSIRTRRIKRTALFDDQHEVQYVMGLVQEQVVAPHQRVEEDLSKFKLGIDRTNAAVTITDARGTIVYVNPAYEKIYGYSREEVIGQNPRILKSGRVSPEQYQRFWARLLAGEPVTGEIINKAKDGRLIPVETNNTPILDANGKITGFLSIQYDISERKQVEVDLRKFKLGLDRSSAAIFITTREGEITYVNPAFEKTYGYLPEEAIGRTPRILKSGVIPQEQYTHFWQTLLAGQTVAGEIINKTKDGRLIPIEGSNSPILDDDGNIIGFLAMHTDITERKRAEAEREQLLKSEAKRALQLQTAAEISSAASTVLDVDELLPFVVNLIQQRFNLYYVGLFFVNETYQSAVLRAATGEAGRNMLERGHQLPIDDRSMIGWCIGHETARIASDVGEDAVRFSNPDLPETHSELALPLISRGQVLGAMSVQSTETAAFSSQDITVLQTMADQLATAIANAQLLEQSRAASQQAEARLRETQFLQRVGQASSAYLDPERVYDVVFDALENEMNFTHIALNIFNEKEDRAVVIRASGTAKEQQGLDRRMSSLQNDIIMIVARHGKIEVIDGWDDRFDRDIYEAYGHATLVRAFVPLRLRGQSIGLLEAGYQHAERSLLTADEVRLLGSLADLIAVAVNNAQLFEETQRRITELAVVNEIGRTLTSTQDINQLFATIHQQVGRLFEASNFYIATYAGGDEWSLDYQYEHNQLLPPTKHKLGRGFTSYILQTRQPLLIRSAQENTAFHTRHDLPTIDETAKSWMGVPLIVAGNITGVMGIQSYEREGLYDEHNVTLFSTIGTQAAAAIQNMRLLQEARLRANELAALNELSRTLASQLSVNQVLEEVWHGVSHLLDTTNFYIALYDPERQEISFPINASESVLDKEITVMPASQGLTGYIIRTGQPLLIKEDVQSTIDQLGLENVGAGSQSYLGVPIAVGDQILGAVAIQSYTKARVYNEHDQNLLMAIAGQTAIALQNARLFGQTQAARQQAELRLREVQILQHFSQQVSGTLDLERVLDALVSTLSEEMHFGFVAFVLIDEPANAMRTVRATGLAQGMNGLVRPLDEMQNDIDMDVARKGKIEVIDGWDDRFDREIFEREGHAALVRAFVPLRLREQTVGVLEAGYRRGERPAITPEETRLLGSLADQVAVVIQNTRLFEQTQARARREQILREVTTRVRSSTDPDTVMRTLARELGTVLGRSTFVRLTTEQPALTSANGGNGDQPTTEGGK